MIKTLDYLLNAKNEGTCGKPSDLSSHSRFYRKGYKIYQVKGKGKRRRGEEGFTVEEGIIDTGEIWMDYEFNVRKPGIEQNRIRCFRYPDEEQLGVLSIPLEWEDGYREEAEPRNVEFWRENGTKPYYTRKGPMNWMTMTYEGIWRNFLNISSGDWADVEVICRTENWGPGIGIGLNYEKYYYGRMKKYANSPERGVGAVGWEWWKMNPNTRELELFKSNRKRYLVKNTETKEITLPKEAYYYPPLTA
jgi:hypothetical protein